MYDSNLLGTRKITERLVGSRNFQIKRNTLTKIYEKGKEYLIIFDSGIFPVKFHHDWMNRGFFVNLIHIRDSV